MLQDQPIHSVKIETNDFDELASSAQEWDQQYSQLSAGQYYGSLELAQIGSSEVMREVFGRKTHYRGTAPSGCYGFALPIKQIGCANWVGQTVEDDTVVVQAPEMESQLVTGDYWEALEISIPESEVRRIMTALSGGQGALGRNHRTLLLSSEAATVIRRFGSDILAATRNLTDTNRKRARHQSDQLKKTLLWELSAAVDIQPDGLKPKKAWALVRAATDLVMSDPEEPVGLVEICEELNVSLRTLQYAFNSVTGMSAATWLRRIRLNSAHRVLKAGEPSNTKINDVVLSHGFVHLGHFAKQYQRLFGCLPSETLASSRS